MESTIISTLESFCKANAIPVEAISKRKIEVTTESFGSNFHLSLRVKPDGILAYVWTEGERKPDIKKLNNVEEACQAIESFVSFP